MNQPQHETYDLPEIGFDADEQLRRPPQVLSIVTLIVGLLSFLALFQTMFWVFPFAAVVLGMISLFALARNPEKIGRKAALLGLVLALFFGAWSASRYFSRQMWLCGHARQNAEIWLDLVKEQRLREAHQLHLRFDKRARNGENLEDFYATVEYSEDDFVGFFGSPPLDEFAKVAPEATVEYKWLEDYSSRGGDDDLVLRYVARYEKDGQPKVLEMLLTVRRTLYSSSGETGWAIHLVEDANG